MNQAPIRRAQVIAPFGTGALYTTADGTAMITAGLDHWFKRDDGSYEKIVGNVQEVRRDRVVM